MAFRFLPKEFDFFKLFNQQAQFAVTAATLFNEIVSRGQLTQEKVQQMRDIEHQADDVTHAVFDNLNKTFITPFDREDIHALASELDSVVDMIYTITNRMFIYRLTEGHPDLAQLADVIEKSARALAVAVENMEDMKNYHGALEACIEVNRLENVGDSMRDAVLGKLFDTMPDHIQLIKWKEIFQFAEDVLDICEDVAHVVETILVKNA
jgi:hypothetical protein